MTIIDPNNRLFALARTGKRLTHGVLALVLALVFTGAGQILGGIIAFAAGFVRLTGGGELASQESPVQSAIAQAGLLICAFGMMAMIIWLWVRLFERRPLWTLGLERAGAIAKYARGVLVGIGLYSASLALSASAGYIAYEPGDPRQQGFAALGGVLLVYLGWAVQGPVEELLCRGWLLQVLGARYRPWIGILASSLFFALLHGLNPDLSAIALLNLLLFGLFAALYALRDGSLWGVGSMHAAWNWAQGNLFGIAVSGNSVGGGILFNLREVGPDLVTGGAFGSEGGLAVTAVLLAAIGVVVVVSRRSINDQAIAASSTDLA